MNACRLAILARENSWYLRELRTAAAEIGIHVERLDFSTLTAFPHPPQERPENWSPAFDAAIVRTMPLGSLEQVIFRMDALRCWESERVAVVNSTKCLETSIDKLLTLDAFRVHHIPFPKTMVCQTADQAMEAFELLDGDVVVKPIFGGEGRGIIRICEKEIAYRVFKSLEYSRSVIYCQKFIADVVKDLRILLIGDKHFSISRTNANSWIRNASQGGTGESYGPSQEELELAHKAADAVDGYVVGVDILQDKSGRLFVLEINAVPGWQLLQKVTGVEIAKEVIASTLKQIRN